MLQLINMKVKLKKDDEQTTDLTMINALRLKEKNAAFIYLFFLYIYVTFCAKQFGIYVAEIFRIERKKFFFSLSLIQKQNKKTKQ
jgi:hypothetical protein